MMTSNLASDEIASHALQLRKEATLAARVYRHSETGDWRLDTTTYMVYIASFPDSLLNIELTRNESHNFFLPASEFKGQALARKGGAWERGYTWC